MFLTGLTDIPTEDLKIALSHLHKGQLDCPLTIVALTRVGLQHRAEAFLRELRGLEANAVRVVLTAVIAERIGPK